MDRASGTIDLANGRYGEVRMASPVPFTQKRTVVIRAKVMESKRIYRDIEISSDSTLEDLALATGRARRSLGKGMFIPEEVFRAI